MPKIWERCLERCCVMNTIWGARSSGFIVIAVPNSRIITASIFLVEPAFFPIQRGLDDEAEIVIPGYPAQHFLDTIRRGYQDRGITGAPIVLENIQCLSADPLDDT
jgi:hypothetical protein